MSGFSFVSAASGPSNFVKAPAPDTVIKNQDFMFEAPSWEDKPQDKAQKAEQKNESKSEKWQAKLVKEQAKEDKIQANSDQEQAKKEERGKIVKNLNNLLIESYKVKFSKILSNLSYNIKDKSADDKIKILSTVLITTKNKIEEIDSIDSGLSQNKKEVLEGILNHIRDTLEQQIEDVAKKK